MSGVGFGLSQVLAGAAGPAALLLIALAFALGVLIFARAHHHLDLIAALARAAILLAFLGVASGLARSLRALVLAGAHDPRAWAAGFPSAVAVAGAGLLVGAAGLLGRAWLSRRVQSARWRRSA